MEQELKVLFIEDSEDDVLLIERELSKGGLRLISEMVDTEAGLVRLLHKRKFDLVITDYFLPRYSGIDAIRKIRSIDPDLPCIMISGKAGEEIAVEAMKAGASDFVPKGKFSRLLQVVERELNEFEVKKEKKAIEVLLGEKESQYHLLFSEMMDAFTLSEIIYDETGQPVDMLYLEVNPAFELQTGAKASDVIGKTSKQVTPEMEALWVQEYSRVVKEKTPATFEKHFPQLKRTFEIKAYPLENNKLAALFRDITEKKREEAHFTAMERLSKTAMNFIQMKSEYDIFQYLVQELSEFTPCKVIVAATFDKQTRCLKPEHFYGFNPEFLLRMNEQIGRNIMDELFPLTNEMLAALGAGTVQPMRKTLRAFFESSFEIDVPEIENLEKGCTVHYIGIKEGTDLFGAVILLALEGEDLNRPMIETFISQASLAIEKNNIIRELQKSESRFNSVFEQHNDIIFTLNEKQVLTSINPIGEKLITGKFVQGIRIRDFLGASAYRDLKKLFFDTIEKRETYCSCELDMRARNGKALTFQISFSLVYKRNKLFEIFGIARNITSNKLLHNHILSKVIETEEREKKYFAEELHDGLGSMLSTINIYVGLLRKKGRANAEKETLLKELGNLVNEAVANVRMFANSLTPNVLNDFGLLTALRIFGEKVNHTHPGLIQFSLPDVIAKPETIVEVNTYRILIELINNSVKYAQASAIKIKIASKGKNLAIRFSDNGRGFDVDKAMASEFSGMGIKNIFTRVKSLNGNCEFISKEGRGVQVHITVPLILSK